MNNAISLTDIKSVEQAKSLAFDCIQAIEMQQQNLRALQQRIAELSQANGKKEK